MSTEVVFTRIREDIIYQMEQALLPKEERDCWSCKGKGCDSCDYLGTMAGYIEYWNREHSMEVRRMYEPYDNSVKEKLPHDEF